jgi:hypothetical protein
MNFVLFHLGNDIPDHLKYCVRQIVFSNPNSKIYLITNLATSVNHPNITVVNANTLAIPDIKSYYLHHPMGPLFRTSMLRIFFLESFLNQSNLEDIIHFDNDVLIYENLDSIIENLKKYDFLITPSFETEYVFGFSYIKNSKIIREFNAQLLALVLKGEDVLEPMVGTMPHEMRLMHYVNEQNHMKLISHLPTTPEGLSSDNYNEFNICFDPSSYGQNLGGRAPEMSHYIGRRIIANEIKPIFIDNKPKIIYKEQEYKLCNLHIHNKRLGDFTLCK